MQIDGFQEDEMACYTDPEMIGAQVKKYAYVRSIVVGEVLLPIDRIR